MTPTPTNPFAGQGPDFNQGEAQAVYGQLMKMDSGSAEVYGRMLVGAALQYDLFTHEDEIHEAVSKALELRTENLRASLMRTSIAKARSGEDNSAELEALVEIAKAGLFSPTFLSGKAKKQKRDPATGRWQVMHEPVHIDRDAEVIPGRYASRLDIPNPNDVDALDKEQKAVFQHGYLQIRRMLQPWRETPDNAAIATVHYQDGPPTSFTVGRNEKVPLVGDEITVGNQTVKATGGLDVTRRPTALTVELMPKANAAGGVMSALNALGMPKAGSLIAGSIDRKAGAFDPESLGRFERSWNDRTANDQFMPSRRVFNRLDSGAELLNSTLGNTAPPHVKMALAVARHTGQLGPRAHKILAPTMDRAAYRYRGTERPIDRNLLEAVDQDRDTVVRRGGEEVELRRMAAEQRLTAKGRLERAQREHARAQARLTEDFEHARTTGDRKAAKRAQKGLSEAAQKLALAVTAYHAAGDQAKLREERGSDIRRQTHLEVIRGGYETKNKVWRPGQVLEYMRTRVPTPELAELQVKSGVVPPSEGIIVSADGTIKTQTVGYGDDHYLPFTLKNLAGLKGGYYIRTRTFGGPTSEDVYTALVTGAKGLTVVSNNGVFTLDFDHDLKGGRRFNDKAARMVGRYGYLLDAVKSRQVGGGDIDPARLRELHDRAARDAPGDAGGQARRLEELKGQERANPRLSGAERQAVATEYLNQQLLERDLHDGRALSLDDITTFLANRKASALAREYPDTPRSAIPGVAAGIKTGWQKDPTQLPETLAEELGARTGMEQAMANALDERRKGMQPLRLDGHGYDYAMRALREQFPYYIRDTKWRPVRGADRDDTGYVKPGRNRPGDALAGYFDPGSGGKVFADTIRFQAGKNPVPAPTEAQKAGVQQVATAGQPAGAPSAAAAPAAAGQVSTEAARNAADRAMLEHLLSLANEPFGERFYDQANTHLKMSDVSDSDQLPAGVRALYGPDPQQVLRDQERNPAAARANIAATLAWAKGARAWAGKLDSERVENFKAEGKVPPAVPVSAQNMIEALRNPSREYKFSEPIFAKGTAATPDEIIAAYGSTPGIKHLVEAGELPADPTDGAAFKAAADAVAKQVDADEAELSAWQQNGHMPPRPRFDDMNQIHMRGFAVVQARQLARRYQEAVQKQHAENEAAAKAAEPNEVHRNLTVIVDAEGRPKQIGAAGEGFDEQMPGWAKALIDQGVPLPADYLRGDNR